MAKEDTFKSLIKGCLKTNTEKYYHFVKWFCDTKPEDRTKEKWDNSSSKKSCGGLEFDYCTNELLKKDDIQVAIKTYLKNMRNVKMLSIYEKMYEKALDGDVRCADWCANFFNSDFFENKEDEVDSFLNGINIEGLNNGD